MLNFSITGVDQSGVEAILANPLPGTPDLGSFVGRPVSFARKVVGQITRLYKDSVGPWVCKVALDDMNALRLSATGCLTSLTLSGSEIELRDRVEDHGKSFEYVKADGSRLAKSFTGLREHELLAKHISKLPTPLRKNEELALLLHGTEFEQRDHRKPGGAVRTNRNDWPNTTAIGPATTQVANRNAQY